MQGIARAGEKAPAQEQGKTMEKQDGNRRKSEPVLTHRPVIATPAKAIARRQEAPGADVRH